MNETNVDGAPDAEPLSAEASEGSGKHGGRKKRPFRTRRWLAGFLVVLFSISLFATVISVWGARQVLNTDVFVSHIDTAIKDPAVQESIADYVTKELVQAVDPAKKISAVLPKKAQVIVPPIVSGLQDFVHSAVREIRRVSPVPKAVPRHGPDVPMRRRRSARGQDEGEPGHSRERGRAQHAAAH